MSWARLDDGWHDHPKTIEAGLEAAGLWAMCLTWAYKNRRKSKTPGVVPVSVVERFAGRRSKALAGKLVQVGFFDDLTAAGWPIHDFAFYLPKYDSQQASAAGQAGAKRRWGKGDEPPPDLPPPDDGPGSDPYSGLPSDRVADESRTNGTRASARRNPVPTNPTPTTTTDQPRSNGGARLVTREPPPADDGPLDAHSVAGELAAYYAKLVPLADHGQATRTIAQALDGDCPVDTIRAALDKLAAEKRTCTPNQLHYAVNGMPENGTPANGQPKPSTTDQRVQAGLDLAAKYAALDGDTPPAPLRALPGGAA
jgi:hypothetical protein